MAYLAQAGVPCFRTPESCGDTIAALFARRSPGTQALVHHKPHGKRIGMSEAQAYGVLDRIGIAHAPFVTTALSGAAPALAFDYPVVAKVCSAHIQHKTEIGGVVLDIKNRTELDLALASLRAALTQQPPAGPCEEVLIQPMCAGLIEVLIGYRIDREAGPIVLLAAGGIWAEVTRDRSIRLAPITVDTAMEMIGEVKALSSVTGKRGKPRGDLDALARALSALSQLALQPDLHIVEAEVNPLLVLREGQGVLAVDALVIGEQ
jgi:acetate---CoA ligase (ADP-forming)